MYCVSHTVRSVRTRTHVPQCVADVDSLEFASLQWIALWSAVGEYSGSQSGARVAGVWRFWSVGACRCLWSPRDVFQDLGL